MNFFTSLTKLQPKQKATFECKFCDKSFSQAVYLKTHIRSHTGEKRYHCNDCEETFEQYRALISHKKVHRSFICKLCGKALATETRLTDHLRSHTGKKIECHRCKRLFVSFRLLRSHLRSHTEDSQTTQGDNGSDYSIDTTTVLLDSCAGKTVTFKEQEGKLKENSAESGNNSVEFVSSAVLSGGNPSSTVDVGAIHNLQCEYCSKKFSCMSSLTKHLNIHTKEKSFKCNFCEKTFLHSFALTRHLRIHTGEKPYKCHHCSRHFSDPSTRNRHAKMHTHLKQNQCKQQQHYDAYAFSDTHDIDSGDDILEQNGDYNMKFQSQQMVRSSGNDNDDLQPVQYSSSYNHPKQRPSSHSIVHQHSRTATTDHDRSRFSSTTTEPDGTNSDGNEDDMQPVLQILSDNQEHCFIMNSDSSKEYDVINDL